jgi:hypothetical protein
MATEAALRSEFEPTMMRGLVEYGPFDTELSLELGLSLWLHASATSVDDARSALIGLRSLIIEVSGLDPKTEPFPLIGRSAQSDLILLAAYLGALVSRAASFCGSDAEAIVEQAVSRR